MDAKLLESASRLLDSTTHHAELPWVMWTAATFEGPATSRQHMLLHHVTRSLRELGSVDGALNDLRAVIETDRDKIWQMLRDAEGDLIPLYRAAITTVAVRGKARAKDLELLATVAELTGATYDSGEIRVMARSWA